MLDTGPAQTLLAKHRVNEKPYDVVLDDVKLRMLPGVFCPGFTNTSRFLNAHVDVGEHERVLDIFAGSGYQGIAVATRAASVICTDHSAEAVRCAESNAALNGVADRVEVRCGDLFEPVIGERFDVIIANPPLLPGEPGDMLETAIFDPGMVVMRGFLSGLADHVAPGGRVYLVYSDAPQRLGVFDLDAECARRGLSCVVVGERPVGYETYSVYLLRRR